MLSAGQSAGLRSGPKSKGEVEARGDFLKSPQSLHTSLLLPNEQCAALLTCLDYTQLRCVALGMTGWGGVKSSCHGY